MSKLIYGLSYQNLLDVRDKLAKQRSYLENETFITGTGQFKSLLDISYSANHSERYFSRVLNKVHTFVSYNLNLGNDPVFMTMTLDGYFRDFLKGDFSRFKSYDYQSIPNNERFGFLLDKIASGVPFDLKDLYQVINFQFFRFLRSYTLRRLKKLGLQYSYIRVAEPHRNGVPHFHALFYCPPAYILDLKKEFEKFFPAPQNHKPLNNYHIDTKGFQTSVRSASSYVLKYILKSFRNVVAGNEPDFLDAWYSYNRVPRMVTSHTLVSQDIYHKVALLDDDWYYISKLDIFKDTLRDYVVLTDDGRKIVINSNRVSIYNNGSLVRQIGEFKPKPNLVSLRKLEYSISKPIGCNPFYYYRVYIPKLLKPKNRYKLEFVYLDKLSHTPVRKIPSQSLYELYLNFDFDKYNPAKYGLVKKELMRRGLIPYEYINLNDYSTDFDYF